MTDPRITDEAVEAAAHSLYKSDAQGRWEYGELELLLAYREVARAALEAALPHLAPQPVVDREAVERVLRERMQNSNFTAVKHEPVRTQVIDQWVQVFADAVLELLGMDK